MMPVGDLATPAPDQKLRIVVLISGSGSNLQALIDAIEGEQLNATIVAVISNRPEAKGLARAQKHGIATAVLNHDEFSSRLAFDESLRALIDSYSPDLVLLAGFMRILTPVFVEHYHGRMLNIHPSLLPKYQGLHTHRRAIEARDLIHGATVHFVTAELDGGPAIIQTQVPVEAADTEQLLAARVLEQEHKIYPMAVKWFAEGRIELKDGVCWLDGEKLPPSGYLLT